MDLWKRFFNTNKADSIHPLFLYTDEEYKQYEQFLTEQFGKYETIFNELISPIIQLDIVVIPPIPENNYYKLITCGMGAYKMNVQEGLNPRELERAELVMYLPPNWNIHSEAEEDYWPIKAMKEIGRMPIYSNSWIEYGHTTSDRHYRAYAKNTKLCSMLLLKALNNKGEKLDLTLRTTGKINFYQLFPLYKEELLFRQKNSVRKLLSLFSEEDRKPILNINRKNYCID